MAVILNLTQHLATKEQKEIGVIDIESLYLPKLQKLLIFEEIPTQADMEKRANSIMNLASSYIGYKKFGKELSKDPVVMIGGASYFMSTLEKTLKYHLFQPVYSFSKRVSVEKFTKDGSVEKINKFNHLGFIYV